MHCAAAGVILLRFITESEGFEAAGPWMLDFVCTALHLAPLSADASLCKQHVNTLAASDSYSAAALAAVVVLQA